MLKIAKTALAVSAFLYAAAANAAVVPEYADNNYQNHELSRAEQRCLDEGYKITYANCSNQTAPADRCPHHKSYYRSCSQEQWCRNNNYRFLDKDCKRPLYPDKMCPNNFPLYRSCQENIGKACEAEGFKSKDSCQLSDKRCPYSNDYGLCCGNCEEFSHLLTKIPAGYIADGETCTTCQGIVKTNVKPAPCEGFKDCPYGPMSAQTPSCLQGEKILYSACKTADTVCHEKGFTVNACSATEDFSECPENPALKKCTVNCFKYARAQFPEADIIAEDTSDPRVLVANKTIRSLIGINLPECRISRRPLVKLTINQANAELYQNLFDRRVENLNFELNFEEPLTLSLNGDLNNVKIKVSGNLPECPFRGESAKISGVVSFEGIPELCGNFQVAPEAKLLTSGTIKGNIDLAHDSALGVKGDLLGYLRTGKYTEVFIKGRLEYSDPANSEADSQSIVFGCNSKNKIAGGIVADTSTVYLKQWAKLDTSGIKMISTTDNSALPNLLSGIHLYKYANVFTSYGSGDSAVIYPLQENDGNNDCDDRYYTHIGSTLDHNLQSALLEPSNLLEDKWTCRRLGYKELECD